MSLVEIYILNQCLFLREHAKKSDGELGQIWSHNREYVALVQPASGKIGRNTADAIGEFPVGQRWSRRRSD